MTFKEFLSSESYGIIEPGDLKNGTEYARKKVRSKVMLPDGDEPAERKIRSPEDVMGRKSKQPSQSF